MYNSVKQHYENHLASFYTWMTGDFEMKVEEQHSIFESFGICPFSSRIAFDLGAGTGIQSMALAKAGYRVMAVDFNDSLLAELQKHNHPSIECKTLDILEFLNAPTPTAELIVCMGDTLTHFDTVNTVKHVITKVTAKLCSGGKCMLSFRDLTMELKGLDRFIPVRSDDNRILTCFLEYFDRHVLVHDLLNERTDNGWTQRMSAYPKLRLSAKQILDELSVAGLKVARHETIQRMEYVLAVRP
ncbi:MAG TPA: class I SAM-dependent methyltransferase [Ohtaekwangia sp.]|nr:class I SAM-dependent methyltransferase [Ohtaekwangia sp.]